MHSRRMFKNATSTWIVIAVVVLAIICGNAFLAVKTTRDLAAVQKSLTNTGNILLDLEKFHLMILSAESSQRGFLLTEIKEYLAPYTFAVKQLSAQIETVRSVKTEIINQQNLIDDLISLTREKMADLQETVVLALNNKEHTALSIVKADKSRNLSKEINRVFKQIIDNEVANRESQYRKLEEVEHESTIIFIFSAFTSAFLLLGMITLARLNLIGQENLRRSLEQQNQELTRKVQERTQELTLYSEELARSNRELEDFAFVASHDLQEPLRKIRAFGDRLNSAYAEQLGEKGADYLKRMKNAAERMSNLISDLLEFSRVSTRGKEFVAVDLSRIITAIISDLEIAIEESHAKLNIEDLPTIQADPSQMHQLFVNLISNAIKFRNAEKPPSISLTCATEDVEDEFTKKISPWIILVLEDNGIGFEQEFAEKIFVPFQRLHARTDFKGTGIGLAVCRRIVERHGGSISAKSILGTGTKFTIKMPQNATLKKLK